MKGFDVRVLTKEIIWLGIRVKTWIGMNAD